MTHYVIFVYSGVFAKDEDADLSVEARAVRWKLRMMDTNHNSVGSKNGFQEYEVGNVCFTI